MTTILLTRPLQRAEPLRSRLQQLGFEILLHPVIEILEPEDYGPVDEAIRNLATDFDWLVFSSINGVDYFFDRCEHWASRLSVKSSDLGEQVLGKNGTFLRLPRLAVVGPGTNDALCRRLGRRADLCPLDVKADTEASVKASGYDFSAEGLLEVLLPQVDRGQHFLLPRANRGGDLIRKQLEAAGASVTEIIVYRSEDLRFPDPEILKMMIAGKIGIVTVTSPAIASSLVRLFGESLRKTQLVCISLRTASALRELGHSPNNIATTASIEGLVEMIEAAGGDWPKW